MKTAIITAMILALGAPTGALALESVAKERIQFSIEDNGNWRLTDSEVDIAWEGEWITPDLMKVTGSDGSCFILVEKEGDMVSLDCSDFTAISILFSS